MKTAGRASRVEALALKGRNSKTRWREEFAGVEDEAQRRSAAMSQMLRQSYGAYREAFRADLNHFYSGLAALQMGAIFLDLGRDEGWAASFDSDDEANEYRRAVESEVVTLKPVVQVSLEAALKRFGPLESERIWADISRADLVFLNEDDPARVVKRYQDVIPRDNPFAWDAAKGQLQLFASLGVKAKLARAVIEAMDARLAGTSGSVTAGAVKPPAAAAKPLHIVVFSGHRFDEPGRRETRFPATLEQSALRAIQSRLSRLAETDNVVGLASAEPGADILFHEACRALGIPSTLCLPMPKRSVRGSRGAIARVAGADAGPHPRKRSDRPAGRSGIERFAGPAAMAPGQRHGLAGARQQMGAGDGRHRRRTEGDAPVAVGRAGRRRRPPRHCAHGAAGAGTLGCRHPGDSDEVAGRAGGHSSVSITSGAHPRRSASSRNASVTSPAPRPTPFQTISARQSSPVE